jgi:hypothetical protein
MGCKPVSFWTTVPTQHPDSAPFRTEVQITDSTFAQYSYGLVGCFYSYTGTCFIRKSNWSSDTLFVYDILPKRLKDSLEPFSYEERIIMVFLRKRKKLYPIYKDHPQTLVFGDSSIVFADTDSSLIEEFYVNWEGWENNKAFLDYSRHYTLGKYEFLRQQLADDTVNGDSVKWDYYGPRTLLNDTTRQTNTWIDWEGPLKNNGR